MEWRSNLVQILPVLPLKSPSLIQNRSSQSIYMSQLPNSNRLTQPVTKSDHKQGLLQAPVVLVEYGDYCCPHCGEAYRVVQQLQPEFGHQLCFVFRHFPLMAHPQAQRAAEAAEAAAVQNRFWQMHQALFEHQQTLGDGSLVEYANYLGLNMPQFLWNFSEHVYANRVRADFLSGVQSGVAGTPTFFINGTRYDAHWSFDALHQAIKTSISQAT